jgi:cell wall-associated NlpC family hydrolase
VLVCGLACLAVLAALSTASAEAKPPKKRAHVVRHPSRRAMLMRAERRRRHRVIRFAWRAVGVRYRWGGSSLRGFDCSGLTRWVYRHVGVSLPHYSASQWRFGRRVSRGSLVPGDLLFFSGLGHVGIYVGHGAVIHAPHVGARVQLTHLRGWLGSSFYGARRIA